MKNMVRVLALLMLAIGGYAQPKIEVVGGSKLDLGSINRGKVVDREVTIKNTGTEALSLGRIEASCGCTGTLLSSDNIPPGKTGTMKITFNSQNFSGPVHKTVTINSNDPNSPRTVVEFRATVVEEVMIQPAQIWFRDAEVGRVSTFKLTVRNGGSESLSLKGFRTQLAGFSLRLPEASIEPGQAAEVVAEFKPGEARPVLSDGVFLATSSKNQPEVFIQIYGTVREFKFQ